MPVVDDAQDIVALGHVVDDDPEGIEVEDLVHGLVLGIHLAVDGVGVLHAAIDVAVDVGLPQAAGDLVVDGGHEAVILSGLFIQSLHDLPVADGIQIFQAQILQLPLHLLHSQPVGNGGIDLHGLEGLLLLPYCVVERNSQVPLSRFRIRLK